LRNETIETQRKRIDGLNRQIIVLEARLKKPVKKGV